MDIFVTAAVHAPSVIAAASRASTCPCCAFLGLLFFEFTLCPHRSSPAHTTKAD